MKEYLLTNAVVVAAIVTAINAIFIFIWKEKSTKALEGYKIELLKNLESDRANLTRHVTEKTEELRFKMSGDLEITKGIIAHQSFAAGECYKREQEFYRELWLILLVLRGRLEDFHEYSGNKLLQLIDSIPNKSLKAKSVADLLFGDLQMQYEKFNASRPFLPRKFVTFFKEFHDNCGTFAVYCTDIDGKIWEAPFSPPPSLSRLIENLDAIEDYMRARCLFSEMGTPPL